ncbi:MAG: 16S rRNA (adenine(1518)-N(6)/adenine(1519)-N(6))-dimethyltransferase RsmA [Sphingomonadales bacterium]|nr:16S rRNA (adenine(1518)-N(6)/adenine(1519)-N(6))-dimethyltransferase RsmA [Sphingomonadales bacterium]
MSEKLDDNLPPLREVISKHGLSAKKSFGQNFLLDLNLTCKIARQVPDLKNSHVLEIGPGPGGLSRALLMEGVKTLTVIEKDRRCEPILDEISAAYPNRINTHIGDAMAIDMAEIMSGLDGTDSPVHICANLPYNVGTALLVKWLSGDNWPPFFGSLTLMFQKEVAERIIAKPNCKAYGRLSVLTNWRAKTRILFDIPPSAFTPAPKVTSSVVQIIPTKPCLAGLKMEYLEKITEKAFGQRRKMLRASLKPLGFQTSDLEEIGLTGTERPEQLDVPTIAKLAMLYQEKQSLIKTS